jgi:hypothetical protein
MAGGAGRQVGIVTGGGRGTIPFLPAPGKGAHRIAAAVEVAGLPTGPRITVARFSPPSPRLVRPSHLEVRRHGSNVSLSWRGVPEATRYELAVQYASGGQRFVRTHRTHVTVARAPLTSGGTVRVRGLASLRQGKAARASFKATRRATTRFKAPPRVPKRRRR